MLDPDLIEELAAHPEANAPSVNLALAEQGHGSALLALAESAATAADALETIARRVTDDGDALEQDEQDDEGGSSESLLQQLDRLLIAHLRGSGAVRDEVLARHPDVPFFVLAAAAHPRATIAAVERAARWPGRLAVFDRSWLTLISPEALPPLTAEQWCQDDDELLREAAAVLSHEPAHLEQLSRDASRRVRRAVASNSHAVEARQRLAQSDPAPEVRARAKRPVAQGTPRYDVSSTAFASAIGAMESNGVLAPDVVAALSKSERDLDEEGAVFAGRALPHGPLVRLLKQVAHHHDPTPSSIGLATGLALRAPDVDLDFRELVTDASKAMTGASARYGNLTGKARLAAWLGDGVAACQHLDCAWLMTGASDGALASESAVLARSTALAPELLTDMCRHAASSTAVPAALLELAWRSSAVDDEALVVMAKRVAKTRRRGQDLQDDEIDFDPKLRSIEVLERVVLAVSRRVTLTPRAALPVVAMDSRRVRYVLTALPGWSGRLSGVMFARVLRQRAGALSAARSEARSRVASLRDWTERIMTDTEVAVALGVGHLTAQALVDRVRTGRHKWVDGGSIAGGADARAALEGAASIKPLLRYAADQRRQDAAALALWLLLEGHDRPRGAGMVASTVDSLAQRQNTVSEVASDALATLERRQPGRLETVFPQTPRGKATLASALARAYRALGGLRDER